MFVFRIRPVCLVVLWLSLRLTGSAAVSFAEDLRPMLEKHCLACHDDDVQKGGVNLAAFGDAASLQRNPKLWETAIRQIRERAMPPSQKPPLEPGDHLRVVRAGSRGDAHGAAPPGSMMISTAALGLTPIARRPSTTPAIARPKRFE